VNNNVSLVSETELLIPYFHIRQKPQIKWESTMKRNLRFPGV